MRTLTVVSASCASRLARASSVRPLRISLCRSTSICRTYCKGKLQLNRTLATEQSDSRCEILPIPRSKAGGHQQPCYARRRSRPLERGAAVSAVQTSGPDSKDSRLTLMLLLVRRKSISTFSISSARSSFLRSSSWAKRFFSWPRSELERLSTFSHVS